MTGHSTRLIGAITLLGLVLFAGLGPQTVRHAAASGGVQALPLRAFMHGPPYSIALSNSYIGNTWRVEMENEFKAACQMPPYESLVKCSWFNSGNDVSKQTQQMDDLISSRVDAIVINAASPTGLNGVIAQACRQGILVVSYDNVVTAPCALKVNTDQFKFGQQLAQFLVNALHGKGNVIMVTGVPGTHVDEQRNKGAEAVWKAHPGIKVIARYTGMWDSGVAQRNTASQLSSLGHVDGIWCQGGTDGAIRALLAAHRPLVPVAGEAENGFRQDMLKYRSRGWKAMSIGQPPYLVLVSLALALEVLQGKHAKQDITIPFPVVTTDTVREGETTFKSLPSSFFADFTDSGPHATVKICVTAATKGKPCPGTLQVHLP
ncbi:MAG TPA: sugar ABC transporter substrate-binding protein [Chloroflexota bacterium]|nr:sugar ABC transporter substrate-binding protein [Chloroflexota bacterium]